jgi:hypothetical protein
VGALLTAGALGFLASEAAVARNRPGDDVVALEARTPDDPELVRTAAGAAVSLPVVLRNAGTRGVVLAGAAVPGSALSDAAVTGRALEGGAVTQLRLQRALDCATEPAQELAAPAPLALTTSGERVAVRIDDGLREVDALARRSCGLLPPGQALELTMTRARVVNGIGRLGFEVRSTSAQPLEVRELTPAAGLRVRLVDPATGEPLALPLVVPPGRPAASLPSAAAPPPSLQLTAVVIIDDCGSPLPGSAFRGGPPFSLLVADSSRADDAAYGELGSVIAEMEAESCP